MRQTGRRGAVGAPAGAGGVRAADIVLGCVSAVLLVLLAVAFARTGDIKRGLTAARDEAKRASDEAKKLTAELRGLKDEIHELRLASVDVRGLEGRLARLESRQSATASDAKIAEAVDAALERRRDAFARDMERRGEEMMARLAKNIDLGKVEKNLNQLAEDLRERPQADGDGRPAGEARRRDAMMARGLDGAVDFMDLWRDYREGKITREEFQKRQRELREKVRRDIGEHMTPEERKRLEERFGGRNEEPIEERAKEPGGGEAF